MAREKPKSFLTAFVCLLLLAGAAGMAFVIVVDPYWYFNLATIEGLNARRTEIANELRMVKAHTVCDLKPANVIIGSSRADLALDPEHPGWNQFPGTTYNLALAGIGIGELYYYIRHAYYASGHLRLAVIGLDDLMFNAQREAVVFQTEVLNFDADRLVLSSSESCLGSFFHDIRNYLGRQALLASWNTFTIQSDPRSYHELFHRNGMRHSRWNTLHSLIPLTGHHAAFSGNERYYITKIWRAGPEQRYCTRYGDIDTLRIFRDLLGFARAHDIELRFFMSPVHARFLIALRESGLWPQYLDLLRDLVGILAEEAAEHHAEPFPLWDFAGFNTITTEAVPRIDDHQASMRWYWEGSHYKRETGDLVLDRVLGYEAPERTVPPDFGVLLTPENVDSHLAALLADSRTYEQRFPEDIAEVRAIADAALQGGAGANCGLDVEQVRLASAALQRGDSAAAEAAFTQAEQIHAADRQRFAELGVPYREGGFDALLARARVGAEVAVPLASWQAYQARGIERAGRGEFADAVEDFSQAIGRGPPNTALYFLRGTTRMRIPDYAGAIEDFEAGLGLDPDNPSLRGLLEQARAGLAQAVPRRRPSPPIPPRRPRRRRRPAAGPRRRSAASPLQQRAWATTRLGNNALGNGPGGG